MADRDDYRLRLMEDADSERVLAWRNSDRVRACMFTQQFITPEDHRGWWKRSQNGNARHRIFEVNRKPVGLMSLSRINHERGECHWGFYLGEEHLPRGTGSIMGALGLKWAFSECNFQKVVGEVLEFNIASVRLHEKLGFSLEGHHMIEVAEGATGQVQVFGLRRQAWQAQQLYSPCLTEENR